MIAVIEELKKEAAGRCAELSIETLKGRTYRVDEYDGSESVLEPESAANEWTTVEV